MEAAYKQGQILASDTERQSTTNDAKTQSENPTPTSVHRTSVLSKHSHIHREHKQQTRRTKHSRRTWKVITQSSGVHTHRNTTHHWHTPHICANIALRNNQTIHTAKYRTKFARKRRKDKAQRTTQRHRVKTQHPPVHTAQVCCQNIHI